jgi:alginate production protein
VPSSGAEPAQGEQADLRERLTEREDKRRPIEPQSVAVAGRPLVISGEYELALGHVKRRVVGVAVEERDRLLLEQELEVEAFYSFGPQLSLFAQARVGLEDDLLRHTFEEVSDLFVERGEMWLYSEDLAGSHFNVDLGRLDFEDDRRWWWDQELDALRVAYELEDLEIALALARELAPERLDRSYVEPEHDRVVRLIGEASWDWSPNHAVQLFLLRHDDRSARERPVPGALAEGEEEEVLPSYRPGQLVDVDRQDESDARLTWVGARAIGALDLGRRGLLGYWLDAAGVRGRERIVEFEEVAPRRGVAARVARRHVRGWGLDAGLNWLVPLAWEPRLFAGYAYAQGDPEPERGTDRAFRQPGLQANEAGFGGVQRFVHYGVLLDPELSNLRVLTGGVGLSLLRSSSLDLVYHQYRLVERASSLRDAGLEVELTGRRRALGQELDLVLAVEEWERLELELRAAAFRAGRAFGAQRGTWSYGGYFALRVAF